MLTAAFAAFLSKLTRGGSPAEGAPIRLWKVWLTAGLALLAIYTHARSWSRAPSRRDIRAACQGLSRPAGGRRCRWRRPSVVLLPSSYAAPKRRSLAWPPGPRAESSAAPSLLLAPRGATCSSPLRWACRATWPVARRLSAHPAAGDTGRLARRTALSWRFRNDFRREGGAPGWCPRRSCDRVPGATPRRRRIRPTRDRSRAVHGRQLKK